MEERNVKLSLERARDWYNKGGELKEIALSKKKEKEIKEIVLPNSWEEFCKMYLVKKDEWYIDSNSNLKTTVGGTRFCKEYRNALPSKQAAEQHLAYMQLHQLRDCYRQGWLPDWKDDIIKYCIVLESNRCVIYKNITICNFLSFQSEEIAEKFLNNFKDLIETAGDLI